MASSQVLEIVISKEKEPSKGNVYFIFKKEKFYEMFQLDHIAAFREYMLKGMKKIYRDHPTISIYPSQTDRKNGMMVIGYKRAKESEVLEKLPQIVQLAGEGLEKRSYLDILYKSKRILKR